MADRDPHPPYVAIAAERMVGLLRFGREDAVAFYAGFFYRRREARGPVTPVQCFDLMADWLRGNGVTEVRTERIDAKWIPGRGNPAHLHLRGCGFTQLECVCPDLCDANARWRRPL